MVCNCLKRLDSGLAVIPDFDPGRNDGKRYFVIFSEYFNFIKKKSGALLLRIFVLKVSLLSQDYLKLITQNTPKTVTSP